MIYTNRSGRMTLLALSSAAATIALMSGCSSEQGAADSPSIEPTETSATAAPTQTSAPAPTTAPVTTAPSAAPTAVPSQSAAPTTGSRAPGPSQTVSGGNSAAPPSVERSPSPPTGDNLPGENAGPGGRPGTPGDDN